MYGSVWSAAFQPCKKRGKILKWRQMRAFSGSVSEWCGRAVAARFLPGSCPTAGQEPPRSGGSCAGAGQQPPHHSWVLHHPCADLQVRTLPTRPKEGKPNDENDAGSTDTFVPRAQAWSGGRSEPPAGATRTPRTQLTNKQAERVLARPRVNLGTAVGVATRVCSVEWGTWWVREYLVNIV